MKEFKDYFSKSEIVLWSSSVMVIIISFCVFDRINYMTLCASLIGVTSLIFNAKGNPFGQLLMVVFSLLYGIISYTFTFRRSPYFALAYAANDIVLIILWILASLYDIRYVSVVVCFIAFFANDIYGFVSWRKMKTRQQEITNVVSIM